MKSAGFSVSEWEVFVFCFVLRLVCLAYAFKLKKFMSEATIQLDCKTVKDPDTIVKRQYQCVFYYAVINLH